MRIEFLLPRQQRTFANPFIWFLFCNSNSFNKCSLFTWNLFVEQTIKRQNINEGWSRLLDGFYLSKTELFWSAQLQHLASSHWPLVDWIRMHPLHSANHTALHMCIRVQILTLFEMHCSRKWRIALRIVASLGKMCVCKLNQSDWTDSRRLKWIYDFFHASKWSWFSHFSLNLQTDSVLLTGQFQTKGVRSERQRWHHFCCTNRISDLFVCKRDNVLFTWW